MRFLGIDPGVSGAIAMIAKDGLLLELEDLPVSKVGTSNEIDVMALDSLLSLWEVDHLNCKVILERAMTMPRDGRVGAFNMGANFGRLQALLTVCSLSWSMVLPQAWKKSMGVTKDKSSSILLAQRIFPGASLERKKDHNRAEALLLAEWLRRQGSGV